MLEEFAKPHAFWGKLLEWVTGPGERPWLGRPYALAEDSVGRLIITDPGQGVVHILDFEKRKHEQLAEAKGKSFDSPVGVAVDAADNIYISDSERARVYVFSRKGKFIRSLGGGPKRVPFQRPTGLALDMVRRLLYVTDTWRHQILVLNLEGSLVKTIGRRGTGPGEFNYPTALALKNGNLCVVDAMNFRIQVLTTEGSYLRSFGQPGDSRGSISRPKGIAVASDGNIYVVDALLETVQVFDLQGNLLYDFGSDGATAKRFALPCGIYIAPRDQIFVADSYNRRVQVFRYRRLGK